MSTQRITVHFSGEVQGVGFRHTARQTASGHAVVGYVKNLPDGRVRLVAEGTAEELQAFLNAVIERMRGNITDHVVQTHPATGEFGRPGVDAFLIR